MIAKVYPNRCYGLAGFETLQFIPYYFLKMGLTQQRLSFEGHIDFLMLCRLCSVGPLDMVPDIVAPPTFKIQMRVRTGARQLQALPDAFRAHPAGHEGNTAPVDVRPLLAFRTSGHSDPIHTLRSACRSFGAQTSTT